ncbi:glycosyltransferase family 2 protein [Agathobacter sp.]|uniref:glycosyltransferase family 2 protein n=2 Tax=Agathobacter sp. TaxID=2021311 RepID=UPI003AB3D6F9
MGNGSELVSIIMAAYNAEKTIGKAIKSVLNQTYTNFELLVVDDASKDKTVKIVKKFCEQDKRVKLFLNDENKGISYTRKMALDNANGMWIAILDSDDEWAIDKLEKQFVLQKKENADLIFSGSAFMDEQGNTIDWYFKAPEKVGYRQLLKQNVISNSSALVRKELYEKNYVIGDSMHEDFAIWLSILKNGVVAYGVDEPLLIYRLAKSSKSGNKFKAAMMNWNTYRFIGLNWIEALYYQLCYITRNIKKYAKLRSEN